MNKYKANKIKNIFFRPKFLILFFLGLLIFFLLAKVGLHEGKEGSGKIINAEAYHRRLVQFNKITSESPSFVRLIERYPGSKDFILSLNNKDFEFFTNIQPILDSSEFLDYLCEHPEVMKTLSKAKNPLMEAVNLSLQFYKGYFSDEGF